MKQVISDTRRPVKMWLDDLETSAQDQVRNLANMPFIHKHVALMPDAHRGMGSTVGSVIATKGAIIPAAVGVDIGCGMCAVKLPFQVEALGGSEELRKLRHSIERDVPVGFNANKHISHRVGATLRQMGIPDRALPKEGKVAHQLGSLGGGNHFIEICSDEYGGAWIMLHSGSRNIGKTLADIHITEAKGLMKRYFIDLPDPDLAYLVQNSPEFNEYISDLRWAQRYAKENRNEIMLRVLKNVSFHVYKEEKSVDQLTIRRIDCHHNYTQMENHFGQNVWVTRKGAVSAKEGEFGIIPGSMGVKSFIVKGKGNPESFNSCSHGAGRRMSRTEAKRRYDVVDLRLATIGVECRKDEGVIDEIPGAYKNIDKVMENQADLVDPVYTLKQLICIKG